MSGPELLYAILVLWENRFQVPNNWFVNIKMVYNTNRLVGKTYEQQLGSFIPKRFTYVGETFQNKVA